jgi:DHA1 family tetracycline resistance protein-like MFS transporter
VISGVTSASISTAFAYVADVTPPEARAGRFGMLGAAFGVGFVLGPALGGLTGGIDPRLPFWIAAALSLANWFYGFFVLPESLPPDRREPFSWRRANPVGALALLRSKPGLIGLAGVNFFSNLAHAALPAVGVLYMMHRYGWSELTIGLTMAGARCRRGGGAGRRHCASGKALRRAYDAAHRPRLRRRRLRDPGPGADRTDVRGSSYDAAGSA